MTLQTNYNDNNVNVKRGVSHGRRKMQVICKGILSECVRKIALTPYPSDVPSTPAYEDDAPDAPLFAYAWHNNTSC